MPATHVSHPWISHTAHRPVAHVHPQTCMLCQTKKHIAVLGVLQMNQSYETGFPININLFGDILETFVSSLAIFWLIVGTSHCILGMTIFLALWPPQSLTTELFSSTLPYPRDDTPLHSNS